jgi:succinate dehydrogenase / fumarate reductase flavoprotein subunit
MSESLRNDGRVWVPRNQNDISKHPNEIPESARDYYLERKYPSFGNLAPRDIASRAAKEACDDGRGVGPGGRGVYLDFAAAIDKQGVTRIREKYGNLFEMYERITAEDGYKQPMRIYPALHYTMGGLWVNYELMSNIPGLFVVGEANFSDHGANRLGASALMQGLADGYFVLPYTLTNWLAEQKPGVTPTNHPEFRRVEAEAGEKLKKLLAVKGKKTAIELHRELGHVMWENVGMARNKQNLERAIQRIHELREEFWRNVNVTGTDADLNVALERANRVVDYMEFGELLALDALTREESCGGHFRTEYQTAEGEAKRDDAHFCHVAAWEFAGMDKPPIRNEEPLGFETVKLTERSYK